MSEPIATTESNGTEGDLPTWARDTKVGFAIGIPAVGVVLFGALWDGRYMAIAYSGLTLVFGIIALILLWSERDGWGVAFAGLWSLLTTVTSFVVLWFHSTYLASGSQTIAMPVYSLMQASDSFVVGLLIVLTAMSIPPLYLWWWSHVVFNGGTRWWWATLLFCVTLGTSYMIAEFPLFVRYYFW